MVDPTSDICLLLTIYIFALRHCIIDKCPSELHNLWNPMHTFQVIGAQHNSNVQHDKSQEIDSVKPIMSCGF